MNELQDNTIAATALWRELIRRRWWLVAGLVVGLGASSAYAWWAPRRYVVETVIAPADSGMSAAGIGGVAGQLARLGGLGGTSGATFDSALALLKTRGLCIELARKLQLRDALFPDAGRGGLRAAIFGPGPPLTDDDACEFLWSEVLALDVDKLAGIATLRATWTDSAQASAWVNQMVRITDDRLRRTAVHDTQGSLRALDGMLAAEQSVEMRQILAVLVQQQLSRLATTQGASSYAIAVMDAAQPKAPQDYSWPRRSLVVALGGLAGLILGAGVVLLLRLRE